MIYAGKGVKQGELYLDLISLFFGEYFWGDGIIMGGGAEEGLLREKKQSNECNQQKNCRFVSLPGPQSYDKW